MQNAATETPTEVGVNVVFPIEVHTKMKAHAALLRLSIRAFLLEAIREKLDRLAENPDLTNRPL
jgi:hypothetical protein